MTQTVPGWQKLLGWIGFLAHLATSVWYAASGLLAPLWAVILLLAIWVALTVVAWRMLKTHPVWVLGIPVLDFLIWFLALSAGEAFLGWTG